MIPLMVAVDPSFYGVGAAIVIAMGGFAYTVYSGARTDRRAADAQAIGMLNSRIDDLCRQVDEAKAEAKECATQRKELEQTNLRLMAEVFRLRNGND